MTTLTHDEQMEIENALEAKGWRVNDVAIQFDSAGICSVQGWRDVGTVSVSVAFVAFDKAELFERLKDVPDVRDWPDA